MSKMTDEVSVTQADRRAASVNEQEIGKRIMAMIPRRIELVITDEEKQAACDLIGSDTYGNPIWTIKTISPENRVVQAFARHRLTYTEPLEAELGAQRQISHDAHKALWDAEMQIKELEAALRLWEESALMTDYDEDGSASPRDLDKLGPAEDAERTTIFQNKRVNDAIQIALERGELALSSDGWLEALTSRSAEPSSEEAELVERINGDPNLYPRADAPNLRELLKAAYFQGAKDVHEEWIKLHLDGGLSDYPDFDEAESVNIDQAPGEQR